MNDTRKPNRARPERFEVRLDAEEKALLEAVASETGEALASWARRVLLTAARAEKRRAK